MLRSIRFMAAFRASTLLSVPICSSLFTSISNSSRTPLQEMPLHQTQDPRQDEAGENGG